MLQTLMSIAFQLVNNFCLSTIAAYSSAETKPHPLYSNFCTTVSFDSGIRIKAISDLSLFTAGVPNTHISPNSFDHGPLTKPYLHDSHSLALSFLAA